VGGALVQGPVAHVAQGNLVLTSVLRGPGQAAAQRVLAADDGVAAVHGVGLVEHVHGPAFAFGTAGDFAVHLGHAGVGVHAAGQGVAVVAVGGDDGVVVVRGPDGAHGGGFLADVDVAEAADLGLLVGLHGPLFEAADHHHVVEHGVQAFVAEPNKGVGGGGGLALFNRWAGGAHGSVLGKGWAGVAA